MVLNEIRHAGFTAVTKKFNLCKYQNWRPVCYLKHDILASGVCLHLQKLSTQLGQIDED
jgi:hypothetical protein